MAQGLTNTLITQSMNLAAPFKDKLSKRKEALNWEAINHSLNQDHVLAEMDEQAVLGLGDVLLQQGRHRESLLIDSADSTKQSLEKTLLAIKKYVKHMAGKEQQDVVSREKLNQDHAFLRLPIAKAAADMGQVVAKLDEWRVNHLPMVTQNQLELGTRLSLLSERQSHLASIHAKIDTEVRLQSTRLTSTANLQTTVITEEGGSFLQDLRGEARKNVAPVELSCQDDLKSQYTENGSLREQVRQLEAAKKTDEKRLQEALNTIAAERKARVALEREVNDIRSQRDVANARFGSQSQHNMDLDDLHISLQQCQNDRGAFADNRTDVRLHHNRHDGPRKRPRSPTRDLQDHDEDNERNSNSGDEHQCGNEELDDQPRKRNNAPGGPRQANNTRTSNVSVPMIPNLRGSLAPSFHDYWKTDATDDRSPVVASDFVPAAQDRESTAPSAAGGKNKGGRPSKKKKHAGGRPPGTTKKEMARRRAGSEEAGLDPGLTKSVERDERPRRSTR